jgi:hypothetical protein
MKRALSRAQRAFTPYNTQANDTEQWSSRIIASTAPSTRYEYSHISEVTFIQAKPKLCDVCEVGPCIGSGKSHITDELLPSHAPMLSARDIALCAAGGCMIIVSMLPSKRGVTAKVTAGDLIDTSVVAATSRIEIRLLSDTRSVFEYLPKTSLHKRGCVVNICQ